MATYAIGDLHGRLDLLNSLQAWLQPDDTVIALGDYIDRGEHPWETLKAVLKDERFIALMGNHEDSFLDVLWDETGDALQEHIVNYGPETLEGFLADNNRDAVIDYVTNLPIMYEYRNASGKQIILTHAGFTPKVGEDMESIEAGKLLWDRNHMYDPWDEENFSNTIVVHGHTPIELMDFNFHRGDTSPRPLWYAGGHKCNLDVGAVWNDILVVLDLDTFEYFLIDAEGV